MKEAPENPPRGPEAFASLDDPEAVLAQAAILLAVGAQLRGDHAALQARSAMAAQPSNMFYRDELEEFPIPRLVPPGRRLAPRAAMEQRFGAAAAEATERDAGTMETIAEDLYVRQSTTSAAA